MNQYYPSIFLPAKFFVLTVQHVQLQNCSQLQTFFSFCTDQASVRHADDHLGHLFRVVRINPRNRRLEKVKVSWNYLQCFQSFFPIFKFFRGNPSFWGGGTDAPCFGLLVTSALGFKARVDPLFV